MFLSLPLTLVCDPDLWAMSIVLKHDTLSCQEEHLCLFFFKSIHACRSYSPDTTKCSRFLPLTQVCDLDLWAMSIIFNRDTHTYLEEHLCLILFNPSMHAGVVAWTRQNVPVLFWHHLWPWHFSMSMVLNRSTLSCQEVPFC